MTRFELLVWPRTGTWFRAAAVCGGSRGAAVVELADPGTLTRHRCAKKRLPLPDLHRADDTECLQEWRARGSEAAQKQWMSHQSAFGLLLQYTED